MTSPIRNRLNVPIVSTPARSRHWWRLIVEKQKKKQCKYNWNGRDAKERDHVLILTRQSD